MNEPRHPGDPLLQRYHEANALDPARPDPALRERVLAQAREQAAIHARTPAPQRRPEAANDGAWKLRALGSLAVLGLVGLLALQFDRSPPEEREVALGTTQRAPLNAPEAAPAAPAVAPSAAPAMAPPAPTPAAPPAAAPAAPPRPRPAAKSTEQARADQPLPRPQEPSVSVPAPAAPSLPAPAADAAPAAPAPAAARAEAPAGMNEAAKPAAAAPAPTAADAAEAAPMLRSRPAARMAAPLASPASPKAEADAQGRTPLMLAAARGDAARVEQLLAAGADRSQRDRKGWTAADHARHAGHEALAQRLALPVPPAADAPR